MVKCKKHGLVVTGCSSWMGSYPSGLCDICFLGGTISEPRSDTIDQEKTVCSNSYRPVKNKRNVIKNVSTRNVHPYLKGDLNGNKV